MADFPPVAPEFHQRTHCVRLKNLDTTDKKSSHKIKHKKIPRVHTRAKEEREKLGLNDPILVQYGRWFSKVLHGDFGTSYSNGKPVAELLSERLLPTLKLAFAALLLMLLFAIPLGMLSAVYKNSWIDYLVRGITFLGVSIPNFWVGLILLYVVALKFSLLPVISTGEGFEKIILPAATLAFAMMENIQGR